MYYRLEYIEKVGRFYHRSRPGFSFGSTMHSSLQRFHETGGAKNISVEDLVNTMESKWQSAGFASTEQENRYREAGKTILYMYHDEAVKRSEIARLFLTEKMLQWNMGKFVLTGRIDRIDEYLSDGALEIVDYKSGRTEISDGDVREMLSMCIYQLLTKRNYPNRRVFATVYALMSGMCASAELSNDELVELEDMIRGIGLEILETDFECVNPAPLPETCPNCDFLVLCRKYWKQQGINYPAAFDDARG